MGDPLKVIAAGTVLAGEADERAGEVVEAAVAEVEAGEVAGECLADRVLGAAGTEAGGAQRAGEDPVVDAGGRADGGFVDNVAPVLEHALEHRVHGDLAGDVGLGRAVIAVGDHEPVEGILSPEVTPAEAGNLAQPHAAEGGHRIEDPAVDGDLGGGENVDDLLALEDRT
ncbi:MAG: hypothetical protein AAGF11_25135 [Myxococcota bacterium]